MISLSAVLTEILGSAPDRVADVVDRSFSPDFEQRVDGRRQDRAGFVAALAELVASTEEHEIVVLDEIRDGPRYAERHRIRLRLTGGWRIDQEVLLFARLDGSGRFLTIDEAVLPSVGGSSSDG